MVSPQKISRCWEGRSCVVAASGPSLTPTVAHAVRMARWLNGWNVLCVNDAYRLLPHADMLYSCDWGWWKHHQGAKSFDGTRWTCHSTSTSVIDDKSQVAGEFDVNLIEAADGKGFSSDQQRIHYGRPQGSSGFQAVNFALLMGATRVVLVGFDGHAKNGKHFFGDHPPHLNRCDDNGYKDLGRAFVPDNRIVNATPGSSIEVYKFVDLEEALRDDSVHRDRPVPDSRSNRDCAA